ncbi:2-oxo-hept-4-ene-1,7-dioate hydratase [Streptomyces sp. NPDC058221]|uniref:2-oxo-hept-4-ene-1,7-dioate hydratase n=1 Tax=Streptomyces sp. NPDC058221 TaxID=3346388 RepID=UPI0036EBB7C8
MTRTTLSAADITALAAELHRAEYERLPVAQFSGRHPGMTISDGYAIAREWVGLKTAEGQVVRGHKIGLTSRAMQVSSQITEPDFGVLLDEMFHESGSEIPFTRYIEPRVEVELAFVLARPLRGTALTAADVLAATDHILPALEIIDSRIERFAAGSGTPRTVLDTISDNAANAGIVLGGRPVRPWDLDLRWASALLYRNEVIEETGVAAGVLGNPAAGIVWLARKLAAFGEGLEAGQVVLSGSFTRPVAGRRGDVFHADYGPLGTISFRLDGDTAA